MESKYLPLSTECNPEDLFLASESGSYSYGDLQCFENYFVDFIDTGRVNDRRPLGILARSCDELIFIFAACWKLGIPFIPFNPNAQPEVIEKQIQAIKPGTIIANFDCTPPIAGQDYLPIEKFNLSTILEDQNSDHCGLKNKPFNKSTILGYFFTSGTSGTPKVVPLRRRQVHAGARASAKNLEPAKNQCWLLCLPLHHVGGVSVILRALLYGSAIYRMDTFDVEKTATILSGDEKIVAASLVPTMLNRLLDNPKFAPHASWRAILLGGGPITPELLRKCLEHGIPVIPSYGMTETCAQIAANPVFEQNSDLELESVGQIFEPNNVQVRDQNNETLPAGRSGTIWLKGPQVFDGYLNDDQNAFDKSGWFNTGDFGRLDAKGNLFIEARRTDLIITGGENVSPFEVEAALLTLGAVKEAAVFGIPDSEWGQIVVAAVVFKEGKNLSPEKIREALKETLERFKMPKKIFTLKALPRTETGKIKRSELPSSV